MRALLPVRALAAVAVVAAIAVSGAPPAGSGSAQKLRILFVGTSLTAPNDLPGMVAAIGKANGRTLGAGGIRIRLTETRARALDRAITEALSSR
jgi:hypothetical protein